MTPGELALALLLLVAYGDLARRIGKRDREWRAEWRGALAEVRRDVQALDARVSSVGDEAGASRRAADAAVAGVRRFELLFEETADAVRKSGHDR